MCYEDLGLEPHLWIFIALVQDEIAQDQKHLLEVARYGVHVGVRPRQIPA